MNITLVLHNGEKLYGDVPNYTSESFGEVINTNHHEILVFGEGGVAKHAIQRYFPTKEVEEDDGPQG